MTDNNKDLWQHYDIEAIGLSLKIYKAWPLESMIEKNSGNIYQQIADTDGLVFVRYGQVETIENFIQTLSDFIRTVTILDDETLTYCGYDARRVRLLREKKRMHVARKVAGKGLVYGESPATRRIVSVIGFSHQDTPILVGYRLPEGDLSTYQSILDQIVNSVTI